MKRRYFIIRMALGFGFAHPLTAYGIDSCGALLGLADSSAISVPEIQSMPDWTILPPKLFREYDTRILGEAVVQRIHLQREKKRTPGNIKYDFMGNNAQIITFFQDAKGVLRSGFLNLHQSGKAIVYKPWERSEGANRLTRLRLEEEYREGRGNIVHKLRPKHGILNLLGNFVLPHAATSGGSQYGRYGAVLKNQVKRRSSWLPEDAPMVDSVEYLDRQQFTFYRSDYPEFNTLSSYGHNDVQIFGELDIRDVEYFMVPDPIAVFGDAGKEIQEEIDAMIATGVPVYGMAYAMEFGRVVYRPGRLISAGKQEVRAATEAAYEKSISPGTQTD